MKNDEATNQQIEAYLLRKLDESERIAFEQQLQNDPDLDKAVKAQNRIIEGIEAHSRIKLRKRLQDFHQEMEKPVPIRRLAIPRWASVAAAILVLVLTYWWWSSPLSPESLYAQYFQSYSLTLSQRDASDPQLIQLEQLYRNKNYTEAIPLFDALLQKTPHNAQLQLGAGITHLLLQQTPKALIHFQAILEGDDFLYYDQAKWYSALAYLRLGDTNQCQVLLQTLVDDPEADHHEEAVRLWKQLK